MSDGQFQAAVGYMLGTRDERTLVLLCPRCAADRMEAVGPAGAEISYVETVAKAGPSTSCAGCGVFPLVLPAGEILGPRKLLAFMGRVLKMAEREAASSLR